MLSLVHKLQTYYTLPSSYNSHKIKQKGIYYNECPHVTKLAKFKLPNCPTGMFWNTLCRI